MTGAMVSSLTEQLRLCHQLSALQQSRMERVSDSCASLSCWQSQHLKRACGAACQAIRRGSWVGLQLHLVWALVLGLAAVQLQAYLGPAEGVKPSFAAQTLSASAPLLACALLLAALLWRPWSLAPPPLPQQASAHSCHSDQWSLPNPVGQIAVLTILSNNLQAIPTAKQEVVKQEAEREEDESMQPAAPQEQQQKVVDWRGHGCWGHVGRNSPGNKLMICYSDAG